MTDSSSAEIPPGFGMVVPDNLDDLAAEMDDSEPADADDDADDDDTDPAPGPHVGVCEGGPYAGRTVSCRFPKGFLLVDRPTSRAWLYDAAGETFTCRNGMTPMALDTAGRWRAAEEPEFDVMAYEIEEVPV